jgi:outer membrane protein TolC
MTSGIAKAASLVTQRTLATQEVVYREANDRYVEGMLALIGLNQAESDLFQARIHALHALAELRAARTTIARHRPVTFACTPYRASPPTGPNR